MTCAKKTVTCSLFLKDGSTITGINACRNPQITCPRLPGEGYEKCIVICRQEGHAENVALKAARDAKKDLRGAITVVEGIGHVCKSCQHEMKEAGVKEFRLIFGGNV